MQRWRFINILSWRETGSYWRAKCFEQNLLIRKPFLFGETRQAKFYSEPYNLPDTRPLMKPCDTSVQCRSPTF